MDTYRHGAKVSNLLMGIASFMGTVVLIFYFRWFLKKLRNESYL